MWGKVNSLFCLGPKAAGVGQHGRNRDRVPMLLGWLELIGTMVQIMLGDITYLIDGQQVDPELCSSEGNPGTLPQKVYIKAPLDVSGSIV